MRNIWKRKLTPSLRETILLLGAGAFFYGLGTLNFPVIAVGVLTIVIFGP